MAEEEKRRCSIWAMHWSRSMPTHIVADAVKRGILHEECVAADVKPYLKPYLQKE